MHTEITGLRTELGCLLAQRLALHEAKDIHFNLAGQQANSLLHDGHAWKDFPRKALAGTRRAIATAQTNKASLLVHASFAFVHAIEGGAPVPEPLRSSVEAILECETLVLSAQVSACVVRLGYQYGPDSADLRAYRTAFRIYRPYWSGPPKALQYHLHQWDAASALLAAAKPQNAGEVFYATDSFPASFARFMDAFAHRVGRARPLHLPLFLEPLAKLIIRGEHMQQTALSMPPHDPTPKVPRWKPQFAHYSDGLDQVIATWKQESYPQPSCA